MKYNYVVFNNPDPGAWNNNKDGYYNICLADLSRMNGVKVVNTPLDYKNLLIRLLYRLHCSNKINSWVNLPLKEKWYPLYFDRRWDDIKPYCFVLISNPSVEYLRFLRHTYPNAKIVKFFRDLVSTKQKWYDEYMQAGIIDYWVTYDEEEAKKYKMYYYHEIESKIYLNTDNKIKYDVFFAGRAKERLDKLIKVYDTLTGKGVNCFFYLTGVNAGNTIQRSGITYSDKLLTYREMLEINTHSRCILEINQENAVGYTSRFLEAVMYNRKLLTDNHNIKTSKFYNKAYIQCFEKIEEVDVDFILKDSTVDFHYNNEFSPCGFIEFLDSFV